MSNMVLCFSST